MLVQELGRVDRKSAVAGGVGEDSGENSRTERWCMDRGEVTASVYTSAANAGSVIAVSEGEVGRASASWSLGLS